MSVRTWDVARALDSVRECRVYLPKLTEEEVLYALQLECDSRRRQSIVVLLIAKLAEFNRRSFVKSLKEKYLWPVRKV